MNILFFLTPKVDVGYVHSSDTVGEAAEKMLKYRFTTVPVINEITGGNCTTILPRLWQRQAPGPSSLSQGAEITALSRLTRILRICWIP